MNLTRRCFFNGNSSSLSDPHLKTIMEELGIKNKAQIETWWLWYNRGENHRLVQPVGKQYSYGKGPEDQSNEQLFKNAH